MYKYVFTKKLKLDFAIEDTANAIQGISDDSREQDQVIYLHRDYHMITYSYVPDT